MFGRAELYPQGMGMSLGWAHHRGMVWVTRLSTSPLQLCGMTRNDPGALTLEKNINVNLTRITETIYITKCNDDSETILLNPCAF